MSMVWPTLGSRTAKEQNHLLQSIASSLFNLRAWQSFSTTSLQILFGLPLGLAPSTLYSIHFFTQSVSSFCNTCRLTTAQTRNIITTHKHTVAIYKSRAWLVLRQLTITEQSKNFVNCNFNFTFATIIFNKRLHSFKYTCAIERGGINKRCKQTKTYCGRACNKLLLHILQI